MRAVFLVVLAAGCGFKVGGTVEPDSGGHDAPPGDVAFDAPADQAIDDAPRSWWDPAWAHRRRITIDSGMLAGDVTDFPVLVRIPAASLAGNIQSDCDDLRFIEADDVTPVAMELDTCGAGSGADTTVWIKRTLVQAASPHRLWLYYSAGGNDVSNGAAVFGSSGAGYESVHHMGVTADVTGNGHGLSAQGGPTVTAGQISQASNFDGVDDYYSLSNGDSDFDFTTTMSASAWVKVGAFTDQWQAILAKGDNAWRMHRGDTTNGVGFGTTSSSVHDDLNGSTNVNDGAWHHVAIVMDGAKKYLYVDGIEDEQRAYTLTLQANSRGVRIGMNQDASPNRFWEGQIDEVRISAVARSAAWISAEQLTGVSTTFVTIGDDEPF